MNTGLKRNGFGDRSPAKVIPFLSLNPKVGSIRNQPA
jgi:hypothetical protein